jgi:hypothetical protein
VILLRLLLSGARCFLMCLTCSVREPANYCIVVSWVVAIGVCCYEAARILFSVWPLLRILYRCRGLFAELGKTHWQTNTHTHTQTNGKTLKDERSARRRGICTRTGNTTFTRDPAAFEPAIPVSERPQTCALDRVATGIGLRDYLGVDPSAVKMERSITIHWK